MNVPLATVHHLYIVFINDLIDVGLLERYGVTCKLFADDLKLYILACY